MHAVDLPAATLRLQNCILINGLVNLRGIEDSNFETDRFLEILNNTLKTFQHERSYFSKSSDSLLENWALNGPYLLELRGLIETQLGKIISSKHPIKPAAEDIWSMAMNLSHKSLVRNKTDRYFFNPAINLYTEGLKNSAITYRSTTSTFFQVIFRMTI